jgi:hypothetical protein
MEPQEEHGPKHSIKTDDEGKVEFGDCPWTGPWWSSHDCLGPVQLNVNDEKRLKTKVTNTDIADTVDSFMAKHNLKLKRIAQHNHEQPDRAKLHNREPNKLVATCTTLLVTYLLSSAPQTNHTGIGVYIARERC